MALTNGGFTVAMLSEASLNIDPTFVSPTLAVLGALVGGGASLAAAISTQRYQNRLQRVASEVAKRETVFAEFVMTASHLFLSAHIQDGIALGGDEQRLVGLVNRMRLFAPPEIISGAETVLQAIVNTMLRPSIGLRELAMDALSQKSGLDPLLAFSSICRRDLDNLHLAVI